MVGKTVRRGSILGMALVVLTIVGLLAGTIFQRASGAMRVSSWNSNHLVLKHLVDAGVEELFAAVERDANTPGTTAFDALRRVGDAGPIGLPEIRPALLAAELGELERQGAGRYRLLAAAAVQVAFEAATGPDTREYVGRLNLEVAVERQDVRPQTVERARSMRRFKVSRVTLPAGPALYVDQLDWSLALVSGLTPGVHAGLAAGPAGGPDFHYLDKVVTERKIKPADAAAVQTIADLRAGLTPDALAARAQFVTDRPGKVTAMLSARAAADLPFQGAVHCQPANPAAREAVLVLRLAKPFKGRCQLSSTAPILIAEDITMADPTKDSLTLISTRLIAVKAHIVEASLCCLSGPTSGVRFQETARVTGAIYSRSFPRGNGTGPAGLAGCRLNVAADESLVDVNANYIVQFAQVAATQEHTRQ